MMAAIGTFETCRQTPRMSVYRGRPEVMGGQNDAIDPTETLAAPKGGNASAIRTCAENSLPRRDGAISERAAGKAKPR